MEIIVLGTVGCASVVFLLSAVIICYKAIKRPLVSANYPEQPLIRSTLLQQAAGSQAGQGGEGRPGYLWDITSPRSSALPLLIDVAGGPASLHRYQYTHRRSWWPTTTTTTTSKSITTTITTTTTTIIITIIIIATTTTTITNSIITTITTITTTTTRKSKWAHALSPGGGGRGGWRPHGQGSHGVELGGGLGRLDLHLGHLELGALQPLAQGQRQGARGLALQGLVVHAVLDGLKTQLQPCRQMLDTTGGKYGRKQNGGRMLGVTRLQNSRPVRMAQEENSLWFWFCRAGAAPSLLTVDGPTGWGEHEGVRWKREHMCSTDPMRMMMRWSAMCEPASSGMGMQAVEPWYRAQWVREPSSSQDSWRMWDTHSMNSLGLDTGHFAISALSLTLKGIARRDRAISS
ncbi:hypothetical protein CRUP_036280 [Coryphaenoides rupestris]|nr:hypothetical protein CRUP_036280 [Coryphaenoides rupestris]